MRRRAVTLPAACAGGIGLSGVLCHSLGSGDVAARVVDRADLGPQWRLPARSEPIYGGNAFLPVLFLLASALSGTAVLPRAQATDIYLTAVGALLTLVYVTGLVFRPSRRLARMGVDSLVVLVLYAVSLVGLLAIVAGGAGG